jgi:hypothetical protein
MTAGQHRGFEDEACEHFSWLRSEHHGSDPWRRSPRRRRLPRHEGSVVQRVAGHLLDIIAIGLVTMMVARRERKAVSQRSAAL